MCIRDRSLLDCGRVKIVDHAEIVPAAYLPTFNSRVVESCLHRIPGISEVFLYNNDDYFHFSQVPPGAFVDATDDGRIRLTLHVRQTAVQQALHATEWLSPIGTRAGSLHAIGIYNTYARLRGPAHRMRARDITLPRDPGCPVCGDAPTITTLQSQGAFCGVVAGDYEVSADDLVLWRRSGVPHVLVDVREPAEHAESSIDGARLVPLARVTVEAPTLSRDVPVVVYCRTGLRSGRAAATLRALGFDARSLTGGIDAWHRLTL